MINKLDTIVAKIDHTFSSEDARKALLLAVSGEANPLAFLREVRAGLEPIYKGSNWRLDEVDSLIHANGGIELGMGATVCSYSDRAAYTVVAISASGKQVTLQADLAVLDPNFKPDFHVGGFFGHVSNQNDQSYTYSRDLTAPLIKARLHKDGRFYVGTQRVRFGVRSAFHDYNF